MKLEDIDKKNPFTVPDNYFDNFYDNLQKRMNEKSEKKSKTLFLYFKPLITVAASIIIAFLILNPLKVADSKIEKNEIVTEISEDEIIDYLSSHYSDYEIYMEMIK